MKFSDYVVIVLCLFGSLVESYYQLRRNFDT